MGLFRKKKSEYDEIYNNDIFDNGDDEGIDYSELDQYEFEATEEEIEEAINQIKNSGITSGDCFYCRGKNTMKYDGCICFNCTKCGGSIHEDDYYRWAAGYL